MNDTSEMSSTPQASGEAKVKPWDHCRCGHEMLEHYMTGIKIGYCFHGCGCKEFTRTPHNGGKPND